MESTSNASPPSLWLPLIDDFHLHLRDGEAMAALMAEFPGTVARAIVMPNLKPPVVTTADAVAYRDRILAALPPGSRFQPLMTLYLTDGTTPQEIEAAKASGVVHAVKYYPAGATTNSENGVTSLRKVFPALERMAALGLPLCIHGEVTDAAVDVFEREPAFVAGDLRLLVDSFPTLRIVLEHITTREAVAAVAAAGPNVAATITAHHLLYNRNALFEGGLRPHRYCLPVLKHETDRQALLGAVLSGSPKFFAGTDSAPHPRGAKECGCGAAGMFTAHAAAELYLTALHGQPGFDVALLRRFLCESGADFYGLPRNADAAPDVAVELAPAAWRVPDSYRFGSGGEVVVPVMAGQELGWRARVVEGPGVGAAAAAAERAGDAAAGREGREAVPQGGSGGGAAEAKPRLPHAPLSAPVKSSTPELHQGALLPD